MFFPRFAFCGTVMVAEALDDLAEVMGQCRPARRSCAGGTSSNKQRTAKARANLEGRRAAKRELQPTPDASTGHPPNLLWGAYGMRDPLQLTRSQLNELVWRSTPAVTHRGVQDRFQVNSIGLWWARIGAVARYLNVRDKVGTKC